MNLFLIFFSAFLVNNIILLRFIGLCPYFGVSRRLSTALGMGMAVIFVMVVSSWISWMVYRWVLAPHDLVYLRTASFIVVIASLVQFLEMFLRKNFRHLYSALGIYLPLITTNCAILGVAVGVEDGDAGAQFYLPVVLGVHDLVARLHLDGAQGDISVRRGG